MAMAMVLMQNEARLCAFSCTKVLHTSGRPRISTSSGCQVFVPHFNLKLIS